MNLFTHLRVWQILTGWIILFSYAEAAWAQCPQASFTLPDTVCIGEPVNIVNTSTGATRYEWDFCSGDLEKTPEASSLLIAGAANIPTNITTVFDGDNWFGFFFSREDNTLFRLDFGSNLNNKPTLVKVSTFSEPISRPEPLEFIKEGNQWYALTSNFSGPISVSASRLIRLNFGSSLISIPSVTDLGNPNNNFLVIRSLKIYKENGNYICIATNTGNNTVAIINFGSSITNPITVQNILVTPVFPGSNNRLISTSVIKECDQWYGITTSETSGKIYRLKFGKDLFSIPQISVIEEIPVLRFPTLSVLIADKGYFALVASESGDIYLLDFKTSVANIPTIKNLGAFGILNNSYGFTVAKSGTEYVAFSLGYLTKQISRINFPNNCSATANTTFDPIPSVGYLEKGKYKITLKSYDNNNNVSIYSDSVYVRSKASYTFLSSNQCINQSTVLTALNSVADNKGMQYSWNFGDGATATGATVQHTFTTAKSYDVSLAVTDVCGKTTTTTQAVQIYNPSTANFTPPASICSNQPVTFTDASVVVNDSIVKWEWDFGNNTISNDKNPTYAFTQAGTQAVSLKITGKSGCQTNILKSVSIEEGPKVGFAVEQTCLGVQTRFKDETILGSGTSFVSRNWDFGDNATSTESNPIHTYAQAGTYLVKLTVQNNVGCSVTLTKSIIIRRLPKAAFSTALACAGEGTQFTDASTSADGAITQWEWNFGEPTSSTNVSTSANPAHIFEKPGTYQVKLKVTTTFGCADSVTQAITVLSAPKADFTFQSSCTNREVIFTDASQASGTSITGYYWDFGDNSTPSTEKSPKHTYTREGAYTVQLTVTSSTRCTNTIQKTIAAGGIAVTFSPDTAVCAEKTVTFRPQVVTPNDPVKSWQWDFGTLGKFTTEAPNVTIPASLTALPVSLTVTTNSECSTTTTKTIPVRPSAIAQFSYQSAPSQPLQITFVNQSTGASRYTWDFGDNTQSTSASPVHTYAKGGIYTITLTALHPNGCESVKSILMPLEVVNINQVTIFPNPFTADQTVTLAFMLPRKQPVSIEIIDLTGRTLQKAVIENTIDGLNNPALSQVLPIISSLGKGMYVITLRYGNTLQVQKVIVQ